MKRYILNITLLFATFILSTATAWGQSLSAAGGALSSGTYTLTENITLQSGKTYTIASGKTVTINLNEKTITGSKNSRIFSVASGGTLTINGKGIIQQGNGSTPLSDGGACAQISGTLIINGNVTVQDCHSNNNGGAFYVDEGGIFTMNDGTIKNCSSQGKNDGGAVYIKGGTFNMTGGTISNCRTDIKEGWTYPTGDNLPAYGGADGHGGAVYIASTYNNDVVKNRGVFNMGKSTVCCDCGIIHHGAVDEVSQNMIGDYMNFDDKFFKRVENISIKIW